MKSFVFGQYFPTDSVVHALDPRAKIAGIVLLLVAVFATGHLAYFALWALFTVGLARVSRVPLRTVLRSARPLIVLISLTAILHFFWTPGDAIFSWRFITVTRQGVLLGAVMALRLFFLVVIAGFLMLTTTPSKLSDGLESILSPLKRVGFPAHEMAMMTTLALRFIPTLMEETDRVLKAQLARGADFESGSLFRRVRAYIPVLVPLFVLVFQRADRLAVAMEARGYHGGEGRTRLNPLEWRSRDTYAIVIAILWTLLIFSLDFLMLLVR